MVPAGCVFWIKGSSSAFATTAPDHANCSVGSFTHGFLTLEEVASKDDVCAVLESGWVDGASVQALPRVSEKPETVVYSPLAQASSVPDVVLLRINVFALMTLKDALPVLCIEGKPQCHIVAIAKEQGDVAASVGCALSRARTGMRPEEMTCAIPGRKLGEVVLALEAAVTLDRMMASYALGRREAFSVTVVATNLGPASVTLPADGGGAQAVGVPADPFKAPPRHVGPVWSPRVEPARARRAEATAQRSWQPNARVGRQSVEGVAPRAQGRAPSRRANRFPKTILWIAALCVEHRVPLATLDRHFDAVEGLERRPV